MKFLVKKSVSESADLLNWGFGFSRDEIDDNVQVRNQTRSGFDVRYGDGGGGAYDGKVISVYKADAADRARMEEIGAKYVDQWVEDFSAGGYDGAAVLAEYRRLLAKYAKIRDDEGYPWAR